MALRFLHKFVLTTATHQIQTIHTTAAIQAGHSKWANIRHIKAAKDGQRAALFGKLVRQIRMAIQDGGGSANPQTNSLLRHAIDEALKKSMPKQTIQNTIKRYDQSKMQLKKQILEVKFISNPIYMVCVLFSDNLAALRMAMAPAVKKAGATFTDARHLFDDRGVIEAITSNRNDSSIEEQCTVDAIECGAEEIEIIDSSTGMINFICDPVEIDRISRELVDRGYQIERAEHVFIPKTSILVNESDRKLCYSLQEKLLALDGVDEIYDNILIGENNEEFDSSNTL